MCYTNKLALPLCLWRQKYRNPEKQSVVSKAALESVEVPFSCAYHLLIVMTQIKLKRRDF